MECVWPCRDYKDRRTTRSRSPGGHDPQVMRHRCINSGRSPAWLKMKNPACRTGIGHGPSHLFLAARGWLCSTDIHFKVHFGCPSVRGHHKNLEFIKPGKARRRFIVESHTAIFLSAAMGGRTVLCERHEAFSRHDFHRPMFRSVCCLDVHGLEVPDRAIGVSSSEKSHHA